MKIEREHQTVLRVTIHAYELSALVAAARWIVEGSKGEIPRETAAQIRQVLKNYDAEMRRLSSP